MKLEAVFDAMTVATEPFSLCELAPRGWLTMPRSSMASLHYILAGEGVLHVPGQAPTSLQTGDLALIPAGQHHSLSASDGTFVTFANCQPASLGLQHHRLTPDSDGASQTGLAVLCAHFTVGLRGAGPVIDLLRRPLIERGEKTSAAGHVIDLIVAELRNPRLASRAMIRVLLLQCLIETLRRRVAAGDQAVSWFLALADRGLWPALAAVLEAPGAPHTVESLAATVGMSRSRFSQRFHRSFGTSPMDVVRGLRLQFAARLLLETDAGIARVAERAGYSSRSHFSQQFEMAFGKSPGRYRQDARTKV